MYTDQCNKRSPVQQGNKVPLVQKRRNDAYETEVEVGQQKNVSELSEDVGKEGNVVAETLFSYDSLQTWLNKKIFSEKHSLVA